MSASTLPPPVRATFDDLMRHDGKAELINGSIVPHMPAGTRHNLVAGEIFASLRAYCKAQGQGAAFTDNGTFRVSQLESGRESFSPDAALTLQPVDRADAGPVKGPPTLAVEVRSPDDYAPKGQREMAAKQTDYFEAGTLAVWDVDPRAETVTLFTKDNPPVVFNRGDTAHAEPAVPGWTMSVDEIFG